VRASRHGLRSRAVLAALAVLVTSLQAAAYQAPEVPPSGGGPATAEQVPDVTVPITGADLARIRKALDSSPSVRLDDGQLRFYVQILAKQPSFADYVKGYDLRHGPTKGGNPMTHQEYLSMVTPKEF